jgi:hypothetical protein
MLVVGLKILSVQGREAECPEIDNSCNSEQKCGRSPGIALPDKCQSHVCLITLYTERKYLELYKHVTKAKHFACDRNMQGEEGV